MTTVIPKQFRTDLLDRLLSSGGTVREVAAEICTALRQLSGAPAVRLWLLNRSFHGLDLLSYCCEQPLEPCFETAKNQLTSKSLAMLAIRESGVQARFRPWRHEPWDFDSGSRPLFDKLPYMICIPVISADKNPPERTQPRLIGAADLMFPERREIGSHEYIDLFGKIAAAALLRARSYERHTVTDRLNAVAQRLVNPASRTPLRVQKAEYFEQVRAILLEALRSEAVSIFEAGDLGDLIRCADTTGIQNHPSPTESVIYKKKGDLTWEVFKENKPLNIENLEEPLLFEEVRTQHPDQLAPLLAVPLPGEDHPTGVIRVRDKRCPALPSKGQRYSSHDAGMLKLIAAQASPIMQMLLSQGHRELFIERTAHQVNQPLQGVIAYSSNILDGIYEEDRALERKKLRYIRQMARACAGMMRSNVWLSGVTDFRTLRKTVSRQRERVVAYFLERIIDLQPIREMDAIHVHLTNEAAVEALGHFLVDDVFYEQAVQNILHNAIKYSYPNTTVLVSVRREKHSRDLLVFVTSSGVPIPANERERIFWDRERGRMASFYDQIGTGQGLYIARQIMRGFGGELTLLPSRLKPSVLPPPGFPPTASTTFMLRYPEAFER